MPSAAETSLIRGMGEKENIKVLFPCTNFILTAAHCTSFLWLYFIFKLYSSVHRKRGVRGSSHLYFIAHEPSFKRDDRRWKHSDATVGKEVWNSAKVYEPLT